MRITHRIFALAGIALWGLSLMPLKAWGMGVPPIPPAMETPCKIARPDKGAVALRGTVAIEVTGGMYDQYNGWSTGNQEVDVTLRLKRSGEAKVFRLHLSAPANMASMESMVCFFLNPKGNWAPGTPNFSVVETFAHQVQRAFSLPASSRFWITDKSITNTESSTGNMLIQNGGASPPQHASGIADITFYAQP